MDAYWLNDVQEDNYIPVLSADELESRNVLSSIEEYESYNNQSCEFDS